MLKMRESKRTLTEKTFYEIQENASVNKKEMVEMYLENIFKTINDDFYKSETRLYHIGTFVLAKRNNKTHNPYYTKIIYSKILRDYIKKDKTQEKLNKFYEKYSKKVIDKSKIIADVTSKIKLDPIDENLRTKRFYIYKILDEGYEHFRKYIWQMLSKGYLLDMGNKIIHVGRNKKFNYVLSQKNKAEEIVKINNKILDVEDKR
jgi:hypothetical protein